MDDKLKPRPYDLRQSQEVWRLLREVRGYIHTCRAQHHGTDFDGRRFAIDALEDITSGKYDISIRPGA